MHHTHRQPAPCPTCPQGPAPTAMSSRRCGPALRRGFSLLELLIVIGIIAFLAAISAVMYANFVETARERATAATIRKIHEQLQQRIAAFNRHLDQQRLDAVIAQKQAAVLGMSPQAARILVKKDRFRDAFPQHFAELLGPDGAPGAAGTDDDSNGTSDDLTEIGWPGSDDTPFAKSVQSAFAAGNPDPAKHQPLTESGALLYLMITQAEVFGIPPVDQSEFGTKEYGDTDGDGLMEFLDAWGRPLRFYRWPTRLIKPDGTNINRTVADYLIKGLPAPPAGGERDPLDEDPDDQIGHLTSPVPVPLSGLVNETTYHTLDTYHVPLIVSAGADGHLGLFDPNDAANFGTLAQPGGPNPSPPPATLTWPADQPTIIEHLLDNITNRNQRAGGN